MTSTSARRTASPISDEACREHTGIVEFVGRRWIGAILLALGRGATRFGEVVSVVDGLSPRMLSVRLRELETHGLVDRVVEPTVPVSVHYQLTSRGRELLAALQPLVAYSMRWESPERTDPSA